METSTGRPGDADPLADTGQQAGTDWRAVAFATGSWDQARVLDGIRATYAAAGVAMPAHVAWVPSPLHGAVAALLAADRAARATLLAAGLGAEIETVEAALAGSGRPGKPVRDLVRTRPWAEARSSASAALGPVGWSRACARHAALGEQASGLVTRIRRGLEDIGMDSDPGDGDLDNDTDGGWGRARRARRTGPGADAGPMLRRATLGAVLGQHDASWLAVFADLGLLRGPEQAGDSDLHDAAALPDGQDRPGERRLAGGLAGLATVAEEAGWWWPYEDLAIVSGRPHEIHRDEIGRLHRGDGPALAYEGGFELHAWRGMPLPAGFIESLSTGPLARDRIAKERNAELRRVMLECYGFDRYLADTSAKPLGRDEAGVLWRIDLPRDEPVVMVEVVNATPEPDGTHRTYWLRVPPHTRSAREGVAWTFGLTEQEYQPGTQT
jgi:hypothetical protein